jgi:hypothetical protein
MKRTSRHGNKQPISLPRTYRPGMLGVDMTLDHATPDSADLLYAIAYEAFQRGASPVDVMDALVRRKLQLSPSGSLLLDHQSVQSPFNTQKISLTDNGIGELAGGGWYYEFLLNLVLDAEKDYRNMVAREYGGLNQFVKSVFLDPDKRIRSGQDYYYHMRPSYYVAGYSRPPANFLDRIGPASFFNIIVAGGLHQDFSQLLAEVEKKVIELVKINDGSIEAVWRWILTRRIILILPIGG